MKFFHCYNVMSVLEFPLKQSFLDYFSLNDIDRNVYTGMINSFLYMKLKESENPTEMALNIWDTFVATNNDFFDCEMFGQHMTKDKLQEYRECIENTNDVHEICTVFMKVRCSPFCHRYLPKLTADN